MKSKAYRHLIKENRSNSKENKDKEDAKEKVRVS